MADEGHATGAVLKSARASIRARRDAIAELVLRHGSCDVHFLARHVGTSEATVRRDLAALERQGMIDRSWGAAAPRVAVHYDDAFERRSRLGERAKGRIALAASEFVTPNMVVGLSGGTTCTMLARTLRGRPINIVTNAVNVAVELYGLRQTKVILTGGALKANSYELVGAAADAIIRSYHIDVFFFSCSGVSSEGFSRRDYAEAAVVRTFLAVSARKVILVDSEKLERSHAAFVAGFDEIDAVICNQSVGSTWRKRFASAGAQVIVVPEGRADAPDVAAVRAS